MLIGPGIRTRDQDYDSDAGRLIACTVLHSIVEPRLHDDFVRGLPIVEAENGSRSSNIRPGTNARGLLRSIVGHTGA